MAGVRKRSKSGDSHVLDNLIKERSITGLPQTQQQIPASTSSPLHYRQLFQLQHQGLLTIKPTNFTLTHHEIPQGGNQVYAAWSSQGREPVYAGESSASGLGSSSTRATPVIVCYNSANRQAFVPPSARQRDPALSNPLFVHGFCKWPGCEQVFKEYEAFLKHLDDVHCLNDTSTAQCLIQMEKVNQLESKLEFEKGRLQAMQTQLELKVSDLQPHQPPRVLDVPRNEVPMMSAASLTSVWPNAVAALTNRRNLSLGQNHLRENNTIFFSGINPTLEYYRIYSVRPPLTYAALIRWAILDSPDRQLTLNEIYQWFTHTFAFFRYNTATWKNAVRHNLSLHKCFVRVENVKGSVWTVDELEFQRRRGQKASRDPEQDGACSRAARRAPR
ncbi:forkhead box protein P2-like [Carcharodon carcharias]|uniref:forkhead box protein P2-like n=1 Tax=Carcharodon carcharias TaxID=13397 RepID=UPI001B7F398F|nr:forkhead box protein P2-like [Carcharodon carcharias]